MKNVKTLAVAGAVAAALTLASLDVNAAAWRTCDGKKQHWKSDWTNMYLSTTSFPIGSDWDLHTQYMMSEWNAVGGSNFKFYVGRDTDGSHSSSNGKNEVYFEYKPSESYLGVTRSRFNCYWLFGTQYGYTEADIGINTRYAWTLSDFTGATTGSPYNYELVMLHELGHALGLLHSDGRPATMNTYYYSGGPIGHYNDVEPHGDDRWGLRLLYPDSTTERDVSVSRFYNTGGGSSSTNKVRTTGGSWVTSLSRGSQYDLEYTVENLGTQTESAYIQFFISTNSYISTSDTYIGSASWSMPTGSYATADKRFTVPSGLAPGTYYIGYRVDPNSAIPESSESNNYVSLLHQITVY
ncbi:CARDB domain-containing protein [Reinekea sp. G2M2-21]|uniref:CARDB domain-containing protein n=1 Tax=Reinekea sp. G2M2-21 TaxID=2788942 RepID=UPI0018AC6364|nr:CARDB domain-containing protein [Reinekea sp. G2M2-21]